MSNDKTTIMTDRLVKGFIILSILFYGCSPTQAPILDSNATAITVQKTKAPLQIDGLLKEAIYSKAEKIYLKNSLSQQVIVDPNYITYVQVAYDDSYLYIAFSCNDLDIHSRFTKRDEFLWKDEVVEVFIDTDEQPNNYVELEVSPKNVFFDSYITNPKKIDVPATIKFTLEDYKTAVQVNGTTNDRTDQDQNWTVEMAIPLNELVENYQPEQLPTYNWKINFYRINSDTHPLKLIAWLPTGGNFHRPEKFGRLTFEE